MADLGVTGVIVLDENGTPENEYYTDDTGYNVWQDYIKQKKADKRCDRYIEDLLRQTFLVAV